LMRDTPWSIADRWRATRALILPVDGGFTVA
jgi:hypothetical protein